MPDNLTALTSRIRAQLIDDGTLFSTPTCTAAVRRALQQFNQAAPVHAATLVDVVRNQEEYQLSGADFTNLLDVLDVLEYDELGEDHRSISFVEHFEDNLPWIRLIVPLSDGHLLVRYTLPHTVDGLDGSVESTLLPDQEQVLVDGACAAAIYMRAASRTETINLAPNVVERYRLTAARFEEVFQEGLKRYKGRHMAGMELDVRAWNDEWHLWDQ